MSTLLKRTKLRRDTFQTPPGSPAAKPTLAEHFLRWLDRRNPARNHHKLTRKNLYIFPSRRGFIFFIFVLVLWLLGTNYQNNLILALTFLLISIFIVSILHTYANLAGLEIQLKGAANAYVGDVLEFYVSVINPRKSLCDGLALRWQTSELSATKAQVPGFSSSLVSVPLLAIKRGVLSPPRLCVESEYPLGLLRCWTWLNFDVEALVYPQPLEVALRSTLTEDEHGDGEHPTSGGEDFSALHEYRAGDPLKHVAWKLYAKEQGLYTKEFSQNMSRERWLDFSQVDAVETERKLSALCFWALQFYQQDESFGLLLPGKKIPPNRGENHKAHVLECLARYE